MLQSKEESEDYKMYVRNKKAACLVLTAIICLAIYPVAAASAENFADIPADASYCDAISRVVEEGVMVGVTEERFEPESFVTRAMLAQILYNLAGCPKGSEEGSFQDVSADDWYADAAHWAVGLNYMQPLTGHCFEGSQAVTREETAIALWRYLSSSDKIYEFLDAIDLENLSDYGEISTEARDAVANIIGNGMMELNAEGEFLPHKTLNRAEAAVILAQVVDRPFYLVNEYKDATMTIEEGSLSSTGATLLFENHSAEFSYIYGAGYSLQEEVEGAWRHVPVIYEGDWGITAMAYDVVPGGTNKETLSWEVLHGKLEPGKYRVVKGISVRLSDTPEYPIDYEDYFLAVEFIIE